MPQLEFKGECSYFWLNHPLSIWTADIKFKFIEVHGSHSDNKVSVVFVKW